VVDAVPVVVDAAPAPVTQAVPEAAPVSEIAESAQATGDAAGYSQPEAAQAEPASAAVSWQAADSEATLGESTPAESTPESTPAAIELSVPAAAASAPAAEQAASASSQVPQAPMPVDELRNVLASAGLTLATTDPEKLRAAQEAAARLPVAPRVPRERKPLPPVSNEPLIQVETNR
jgi:ribonuclease E